jgi:hypothetical protein
MPTAKTAITAKMTLIARASSGKGECSRTKSPTKFGMPKVILGNIENSYAGFWSLNFLNYGLG